MRLLTLVLLSIALMSNLASAAPATGPAPIPLWPASPATAPTAEKHITPTLTPFFPAHPNGVSIVVCPGGGYHNLMDTYEGADVARWLNSHDITAFVLRYRVAPDRHPAPILDAQRAIRLVRSRSQEWHIDPHKVGIMGFSAGGHLAASAATLPPVPRFPNRPPTTAPNLAVSVHPLDSISPRPDFAVLIYPVISMVPPYAHVGSANNLLGPGAPEALRREMSLELCVTDQTPPCLLVHGRPDKVVDYHNSELFYDALRAHNVPAKFLLFETGQHGFGLGQGDPNAKTYPDACLQWLRDLNILPADQ